MRRVLLIDGSQEQAQKMAMALSQIELEVVVASSEPDRSRLTDASVDAVIISDDGSRLDGPEICYRIRCLRNLPIILLGNRPEEEIYRPGTDELADWDYYLQRPINHEELAARVKVLFWRYGKTQLPRRNKRG